MATLFELALGGIAIVLGVAWTIWPLKMVYWNNRLMYFWVSDEPDLDDISPAVARAGGVVLTLAGVILIVGIPS